MVQVTTNISNPYRISFRIPHALKHFKSDYNPNFPDNVITMDFPGPAPVLQFKTNICPLYFPRKR